MNIYACFSGCFICGFYIRIGLLCLGDWILMKYASVVRRFLPYECVDIFSVVCYWLLYLFSRSECLKCSCGCWNMINVSGICLVKVAGEVLM
jgi:hypothetical protein